MSLSWKKTAAFSQTGLKPVPFNRLVFGAHENGTICMFILVLISWMILAVDGLSIRRGNFGNVVASIEPAWCWVSFKRNIPILFIVLKLNFDLLCLVWLILLSNLLLTFFISLLELNFGCFAGRQTGFAVSAFWPYLPR